VDDLLAHAAKEPDSDIDISDEEAGQTGSALSAGRALAPANTVHRNALLSVFHDAAQASQERSTDDVARLPNHRSPDSPLSSPTPPTSALTMPNGSSSLLTTQKENQSSGHKESTRQGQGNPVSPLRPLGAINAVPLAGRNSNGKRPQTHEENSDGLFPALAKKPRGGATGRGGNTSSRGGSRTK